MERESVETQRREGNKQYSTAATRVRLQGTQPNEQQQDETAINEPKCRYNKAQQDRGHNTDGA